MNSTGMSEQLSTMDPRLAPRTPSYPVYTPNSEWVIDMNFLMPFSVMLMVLCVLLLIICYLRHRMRQRRRLHQELHLHHLLSTRNRQQAGEFGAPIMPDRILMMYPPTYAEATLENTEAMHKSSLESSALPPPYTENLQDSSTSPTLPDPVSPSVPVPQH